MTIVTFARDIGTMGEEIAKSAAEELDYRFVDREIGDAIAAEHRLQQTDKKRFSEMGLSFWDSFFSKEHQVQFTMKAVVADFARQDNIVIWGWGGQALFKDLPGVLRVRLTAPLEARVDYLVKCEGLDATKAEERIFEKSRESDRFMRAFEDRDRGDTSLYDLILNTGSISAETAVEIVVRIVRSGDFETNVEQLKKKLMDIALTQRAQSIIADSIELTAVNLEVEDGLATLTGLSPSSGALRKCLRAVSDLDGIRAVDNRVGLMRRG